MTSTTSTTGQARRRFEAQLDTIVAALNTTTTSAAARENFESVVTTIGEDLWPWGEPVPVMSTFDLWCRVTSEIKANRQPGGGPSDRQLTMAARKLGFRRAPVTSHLSWIDHELEES